MPPVVVYTQDPIPHGYGAGITTGLAPVQYWKSSAQRFLQEYVFIPSAHAQDITTGLVGHWKFDEGSGTTATDSSGNNNTGTLVNGPVWTTGKMGGALSFDGSDDYVDVGTVPNYSPAMSYGTFSAWIKTDSTTQSYLIGQRNVDSSDTAYFFGINRDPTTGAADIGEVQLYVRSNSNRDLGGGVASDTGITDGEWHLYQ
jgi:hypothetical protein